MHQVNRAVLKSEVRGTLCFAVRIEPAVASRLGIPDGMVNVTWTKGSPHLEMTLAGSGEGGRERLSEEAFDVIFDDVWYAMQVTLDERQPSCVHRAAGMAGEAALAAG